jgi:hypothetical protein
MSKPRQLFALLITAVLLLSGTTQAQNKKDRFDPDGSFWIHGQPPNDFLDFGGINLNSKRSRQLPGAGVQITNGKTLRFKTLVVKPDNLTFMTVVVAGVSYGFSGKFLRGGVFGSGVLDDETPVLEGTLTKYKAGSKVAEAKLKFVYFGGT